MSGYRFFCSLKQVLRFMGDEAGICRLVNSQSKMVQSTPMVWVETYLLFFRRLIWLELTPYL